MSEKTIEEFFRECSSSVDNAYSAFSKKLLGSVPPLPNRKITNDELDVDWEEKLVRACVRLNWLSDDKRDPTPEFVPTVFKGQGLPPVGWVDTVVGGGGDPEVAAGALRRSVEVIGATVPLDADLLEDVSLYIKKEAWQWTALIWATYCKK